MQETREHIKTRMLKTAARLWGYSETEAENHFDPLVSLLLTACATELEKISSEIHSSRARVLERLVQLLAPDTLTCALPAHGIATASSVEATTELYEETQFYTRIKLASGNENEESISKDIFFSPTDTFHLNKSSVRFMAIGGQLFKINNTIEKEVIAVSNYGNELPESTLWLAIDEPEVNLHNSFFYFDFRNDGDKNLFYHQLPKAKWFFHSSELEHLPGYGNRQICGETLDVESVLDNTYSISNKLKRWVNGFYKHRFITVLDQDGLTAKKANHQNHEIIAKTFCSKEAEILQQQPLRWITIQFPETISNRLLQDAVCIMNCFPVINRRLHDIRYKLKEMMNIIPLNTEDIFLDLQEVCDDGNKKLLAGMSHIDGNESMKVLLRRGGVGRFDERNAAAIIDYLLQLLRDESAAFSNMGNDFISSEIKQLQQVINKMEQKLSSRQTHQDSGSYLIIPGTEKLPVQNLFIKYWSTNGQETNNIKSGTDLQLYKGASINNNKALLVSTTQGGRNQLSATESALAYKSAVLSKDRIITAEDIKAFCCYQLGKKIKNITVQKGVMIDPDERQGFMRTIDVVIELHHKVHHDFFEKKEVGFWEDYLKLLLEEKSTVLMHYRVMIKKSS